MTVSPVDTAPARQRQAAASLDALSAQSVARDELRQEVDKREFRLAIHDLAEGLRGMIRVSPLASVLGGLALGAALARRRSRRRRV